MFLLILESIGTSELILIGIIALIVFGPRKLPQMAKTIGKTMADFRRTTGEFKSTWEREAEFYKEEKVVLSEVAFSPENSIGSGETVVKAINGEETEIEKPAIKEIEQDRIEQVFSNVKNQNRAEPKSEKIESEKSPATDKREWL